jgi:endonuclease/exonuclease/phosphatase family metal-dependent hydrolase
VARALSGRNASVLLDLLTINLWGLPWPLARDRRERKQRFRDHVHDGAYDLIGIQELWWPWHRALELDSLVVPHAQRDSGLALAGRLRLRAAPQVRHFGDHAGIDRFKRKGVLSSRVTLDNGLELAVHVTHLQAGRRHARIRARQVDDLLATVTRDDAPALLMGDFNFYGGDPDDAASCARLRGEGFDDAAEAADAEATYTSSNPYVRRRCAERFDRVFLRGGSRARFAVRDVEVLTRIGQPVSDHHPVRVRVQIDG